MSVASTPPPPYALVRDPDTLDWLLLQDPAWMLSTDRLSAVYSRLKDGLKRTDTTATLCCLAYEAASAFDPHLCARPAPAQPLLWMAGFQTLTPWDEAAWQAQWDAAAGDVLFGPWQPDMSPAAYARAFAAIKAHLSAGNAYQINLTQRYRAPLLEPPSAAGLHRLFFQLVQQHGGPHAALVDTGTFALLSLSPETFFQRDQTQVRCRPMKGTAARCQNAAHDRQAAQALRASAKEQAENRMIVDMVRNDLGRIAQTGQVRVSRLFAVEHYPKVHQMISEVMAETQVTDVELLAALFPSASITGAPKVAAMKIIAELESSPRGFYTGTIGARLAGGRSFWSVAIRTLVIHRQLGLAEYGSGGGIVWDSQVDCELAELQLKAQVLADTAPRFGLVETLLLQPNGQVLLQERHLQRLHASARVFGFPCDEALIRRQLSTAMRAAQRESTAAQMLRLVLTAKGEVSVSSQALSARPVPVPLHARLGVRPVNSQDVRLRHKTTDRQCYQAAAGRLPEPGEEVFLFNERHELTEGTFTNLVLELDGQRLTPPVASGLLPGCYRAELLATGQISARPLHLDDLERATGIWAINSVRGMMPALFSPSFSGDDNPASR